MLQSHSPSHQSLESLQSAWEAESAQNMYALATFEFFLMVFKSLYDDNQWKAVELYLMLVLPRILGWFLLSQALHCDLEPKQL